jgi:cytochrome c-type biogenesis protein CcmH/NrfF
MRARARLAVLLAMLALVPLATAAQPKFTMDEIEQEVMCPVCGTRLELSHSDAANSIRAFIEERREQGYTKKQVEDALVAQFGRGILASTPRSGSGLVAWTVPVLVGVGGVAVVALAALAWRRRAAATPLTPAAILDPDLERRVDDELRRYEDDDDDGA